MNLDIFLCFKDIQYVIGRKTNSKYKACLLLSWVVWRIHMLCIQPLNDSERKLYFSLYGKTCNLSMCRAWIKFQVEPKRIFVNWALLKCLSTKSFLWLYSVNLPIQLFTDLVKQTGPPGAPGVRCGRVYKLGGGQTSAGMGLQPVAYLKEESCLCWLFPGHSGLSKIIAKAWNE